MPPFLPLNLGLLRQPNVFTPPVEGPINMGLPPPQEEGMVEQLRRLYTPETEATERFNRLIESMPTRNKPGALRKIGASLVAAGKGGPELGMRAAYAPYYRDVEDWMMKMQPAYQAANLERQGNINERQLAYGMTGRGLEEKRLAEQERTHRANEEIRQKRADIYEFKALNPNMRIVEPKGGNIYAIDPQTGETIDLGIPSGTLSEMDRYELIHKDRLEEIAARGEQSRRTRATVPGGSMAGGPEISTQRKVGEYLRARELYNSRPDLRPFIKLEAPGTNDFIITPPTYSKLWGSRGPTQEQYEEMSNYIYGEEPEAEPTPTPTPPTRKPSGKSVVTPQTGVALREKAIAFLKKNKLPVTEANISHAIQTGRVK